MRGGESRGKDRRGERIGNILKHNIDIAYCLPTFSFIGLQWQHLPVTVQSSAFPEVYSL